MAIPPYLELMLSIEQEEELTMYIPGTKTFIGNADVRAIYLQVNGTPRNFERFKEKIHGLATMYKGKLVPVAKDERWKIHTVFTEKATRHSQKPEVSFEIIDRLYPDLKKLELYARKERKGYDCWGNEV